MTTEEPAYIARLGYIRHLVQQVPIDLPEVDTQFKITFDEMCKIGSKNLDQGASHTMMMQMKRIHEYLDHPMIMQIVHFYLSGETKFSIDQH